MRRRTPQRELARILPEQVEYGSLRPDQDDGKKGLVSRPVVRGNTFHASVPVQEKDKPKEKPVFIGGDYFTKMNLAIAAVVALLIWNH